MRLPLFVMTRPWQGYLTGVALSAAVTALWGDRPLALPIFDRTTPFVIAAVGPILVGVLLVHLMEGRASWAEQVAPRDLTVPRLLLMLTSLACAVVVLASAASLSLGLDGGVTVARNVLFFSSLAVLTWSVSSVQVAVGGAALVAAFLFMFGTGRDGAVATWALPSRPADDVLAWVVTLALLAMTAGRTGTCEPRAAGPMGGGRRA